MIFIIISNTEHAHALKLNLNALLCTIPIICYLKEQRSQRWIQIIFDREISICRGPWICPMIKNHKLYFKKKKKFVSFPCMVSKPQKLLIIYRSKAWRAFLWLCNLFSCLSPTYPQQIPETWIKCSLRSLQLTQK
jgi:hypothetical protein